MRKLLAFVAALLMSLNACQVCSADEALTPAKKADIERLLEVTRALALGQQMSALMVGQFTNMIKQANPNIPQEMIDKLPEIVNSVVDENISTFKQAAVLIYNRHFTHDDVKQMIAFYSTELGKKTIRVMPTLMQESMRAGQQWGQRLAPEIERRVRDRFKKEGVVL